MKQVRTTKRLTMRSTLMLVFSLVAMPMVMAQTDRVYPKDGQVQLGKIKSDSRNGIVLTVSGKDQTFAVGNIEKVMYQGDPAGMTNGREFALNGQYDSALEQFKTVDVNKLSRDVLKADLSYYLMYCQAHLALSGKGDLNNAAKSALSFASKNSDSWQFYPTAKLLGDLASATGNYPKALQYYRSLANAPSTELKIESVLMTGVTNLRQGKLDEAVTQLQKVMGIKVSSPEALRLQKLAKASLAVAMAKQGKGEEGLSMVKELITELNPTDTEMAAEIYNAQGASYEALGDDEGALLAYLHTHLMFSTNAQAHSHALKRMTELWTNVGKPDRAAQARAELQQRYPGLGS